jgi:hypothetical protein
MEISKNKDFREKRFLFQKADPTKLHLRLFFKDDRWLHVSSQTVLF